MTAGTGAATSALAASVTLEPLSADPYPTYAALREADPVAYAPQLGLWLVTRYDDAREVMLDSPRFVVGTEHSLLFDTFGEHMLTTDGERQRRYRDSKTQAAFMPKAIAARLGAVIDRRAPALLDPLMVEDGADLRPAFAARLPVQVTLDVFGVPDADEPLFRSWYDGFEAALANHAHDEGVRARAAANVAAFHAHMQARIEAARRAPSGSLLDDFLARPEAERLTDDELRRNALIIVFGGVSTVEVVTLNALWALLTRPEALAAVRADPSRLDAALDETMRRLSPVQTAARHTLGPVEFKGVTIPAGATVTCMLGSANRDPAVFPDPNRFDLDRPNARKHLGFAVGPHHCLGRCLAKAEAHAAIAALRARARDLRLLEDVQPEARST